MSSLVRAEIALRVIVTAGNRQRRYAMLPSRISLTLLSDMTTNFGSAKHPLTLLELSSANR